MSAPGQPIHDVIDIYMRRLYEKHQPFWHTLTFAVSTVNKVGSPLETVFLILWAFHHSYRMNDTKGITYAGLELRDASEPIAGEPIIDLRAQVEIGRARPDFLVTVTPAKGKVATFAVECDGHSFHDRTPAQASADRARDRLLLREGVVTIRYTYEDLMMRSEGSFRDFWTTITAYSEAIQ